MSNYQRVLLLAALLPCLVFAGCLGKKHALSQTGTGTSSEPDKILYDRAMTDIQHSRYTEARLTLQTLINTYPDSEYLAKATMGVADSYFKEGGSSGYTQAVAEYQNFITFFPFLDEAAYAQMQIGMTHYHRMEKPDRDRNEAIEAEGAFQTYLQKYPDSPLSGQVQQRLREVQEVLAEGDFRVANFYYIRHVDRASAARLLELVNRYPLYSEADRANWMIATLYDRSEHPEIAAQFYTRLVKDYPLSPLAATAKDKLVKFGAPVPQPDPAALARMQKEQDTPRPRGGILSLPAGMFKTGPDIRMAARSGAPTMTPQETDNADTLTPGSLTVGASASAPGGGTGTGAYVETVTPGSAGSIVPASVAGNSANAASSGGSSGGANASGAGANAADPASPANATGDPSQSATGSPSQAPSSDPKNESSSKKKKGLHKIIPF
jgi:outer membrane protein assembly factor BamD